VKNTSFLRGYHLNFGRYAGKHLGDVPRSYLTWALKTLDMPFGDKFTIENYMLTHEPSIAPDATYFAALSALPLDASKDVAREIITEGYRAALANNQNRPEKQKAIHATGNYLSTVFGSQTEQGGAR
jgi:Putative quorum-sensing-regulated virulence factor